jgi:hypothetical protein
MAHSAAFFPGRCPTKKEMFPFSGRRVNAIERESESERRKKSNNSLFERRRPSTGMFETHSGPFSSDSSAHAVLGFSFCFLNFARGKIEDNGKGQNKQHNNKKRRKDSEMRRMNFFS